MRGAVTGTVPSDVVARLKAEVAELQARLDRRAVWRLRARRAGLTLLLVLGCGLVAMSLIAVYVRVTVLDTDRYVETMAPIADSPDVQQAVAERLDVAIASRVDYAALLSEALPDQADPLAPALAGALRQAVRSRVDAFVASDEFAGLWVEANRRAHSRVVALVTTGESGRLRLDDDTVYLDLGPAVDRVRSGLQERGLDRLAGAIPPSVDGRVTLLQSEGFVKARRGVDLIEGLTIVLPILALLCLAGHVALSRPRRRGLLRVGLGLIVTALLLLVMTTGLAQGVLDGQTSADDALAVIDSALARALR